MLAATIKENLKNLFVEAISGPVNSADYPGFGEVFLDALAELGYMLIQCATGGIVIDPPAFVKEGIAVNHPAAVVIQEFQD